MGRVVVSAVGVMVLVIGAMAPTAAQTTTPSYLAATDPGFEVTPLLSVGDTVPVTADASKEYQMVGIPDGLARTGVSDGRFTLYMNHEFRFDVLSEPVVGAPLNRGAIVSAYTVQTDGTVLSGRRAYDTTYLENQLVGPAAQEDNETPAFGRFCSMTLAGKAHGFDRPILLTNEESDTPDVQDTFDPLGGSTVAIFDRAAYALPRLGHFAKENSIPMRGTEARTVIVSLEDGPVTPDSQLYMYVGTKRPRATNPLRKNGLDNGKLFVFVSDDASKTTEDSFTVGSIQGHWAEIPNAAALSDVELESAADAVGAFGFIRIEDGDFSKTDHGDLFFVTTGAPDTGNTLGRLYRLAMDPADPLGTARLTIVQDSATVVAAGGDTILSPDNLTVTKNLIAIQEGGTGASRPVLTDKDRELSVWTMPLTSNGRHTKVETAMRVRLAELSPPGRDGVAVPRAAWEPSGIISGSFMSFGSPSWLQVVQAHPPTTAPGTNTIQDGQLVLLHPRTN